MSARVLRHFNILSFTELRDDSVSRIFTTILEAFLLRNFRADISSLTDKVGARQYGTIPNKYLADCIAGMCVSRPCLMNSGNSKRAMTVC